MCTTGASASCPAPAETRAAALLAPTAGAAETIGNPCVSMTPVEVRQPLGVDDTFKRSNRSLITLRQWSEEASESFGGLQKNRW